MLNSYLLSAVMLLFVVGCLTLDLRLFISRVHWGLSEILSLNKILTTLRVILNSTRSITDKLHQLLKFFNRDQSKTWKINYFQPKKLLILNYFCYINKNMHFLYCYLAAPHSEHQATFKGIHSQYLC